MLAYLTRDRLPDSDPSRSVFGSFKLLPATSVAAARRAADKAGAFGILRVIIDKRIFDARLPGTYALSGTLAFYTLAPARGRTKPKWTLAATQRITPPSTKNRPGLELIGSNTFDKADDPTDFLRIVGDVASFVRNAAVSLEQARLAKAPDGGLQLEVEVTNNTEHSIAELEVSLDEKGGTQCSYSGGLIPPGTKKVTIPFPKAGADRLRAGKASPKVISVSFRETSGKK